MRLTLTVAEIKLIRALLTNFGDAAVEALGEDAAEELDSKLRNALSKARQ